MKNNLKKRGSVLDPASRLSMNDAFKDQAKEFVFHHSGQHFNKSSAVIDAKVAPATQMMLKQALKVAEMNPAASR